MRLRDWKHKTELKDLLIQTKKLLNPELQELIDEHEIASLIYFNWGKLPVQEDIIHYESEYDLPALFKYTFSEKWEFIAKNDYPKGAVESWITTKNTSLHESNDETRETIKSESTLNNSDFIGTDKHNSDTGNTRSSDTTVDTEQFKIDNVKAYNDSVDKKNVLVYNIAKDIADLITLDFY